MSWTSTNGYIPATIEQIMDALMANINAEFDETYTTQTFQGTNFYKYFYAAAQRMQDNEVKTSEIMLKLQQYFRVVNAEISRPPTTPEGIIDFFADPDNGPWIASVKPMIDADAGKISICVNVDSGGGSYATEKLAICNLVKDCVAGGIVSQGTEIETITLSNGQAFDFKFVLPNKIPVKLRLTITQSENSSISIPEEEVVAQQLFNQINTRYSLGKDFEPQRYFSQSDAPWSSTVLLEWSDDAGATWSSDVFEATYDDIYIYGLDDIAIVED